MSMIPKFAADGIGARIGQVIDALGGFMEGEKKLGISDVQLRRYVSGESDIPGRKLRAIAEYGGVSADWILTGRGPMRAGDAASISGVEVPDSEDVMRIPVLNIEAAAGAGSINGEVEILFHLPFSRQFLRKINVRADAAHALRLHGDSMFPTIPDGTIVLMDTASQTVADGRVYVLALGNEVRIKRIHKTISGRVTLKSDNDNKLLYPDETVSDIDLQNLRVIGRVFCAERLL